MEQSLVAMDEAIVIFRRLAADDPAAHEPDLARVVGNIAVPLFNLGRPAEALAAARDALEIYARLASRNSAEIDKPAATVRGNLEVFQAAVDQAANNQP